MGINTAPLVKQEFLTLKHLNEGLMKPVLFTLLALISLRLSAETSRPCKGKHGLTLAQCQMEEAIKYRAGDSFSDFRINFFPLTMRRPRYQGQAPLDFESLNDHAVRNSLLLIGDLLSSNGCAIKFPNVRLIVGRAYLSDLVSVHPERFTRFYNSSFSNLDEGPGLVDTDLRLYIESRQYVMATTNRIDAAKGRLEIDIMFGVNRLGELSLDTDRISETIHTTCKPNPSRI